eukprot:gene12270-biopygen14168
MIVSLIMLLQERLAAALAAEVGVAGCQLSQLRKVERQQLLAALTAWPLPVTGHEGYGKAEALIWRSISSLQQMPVDTDPDTPAAYGVLLPGNASSAAAAADDDDDVTYSRPVPVAAAGHVAAAFQYSAAAPAEAATLAAAVAAVGPSAAADAWDAWTQQAACLLVGLLSSSCTCQCFAAFMQQMAHTAAGRHYFRAAVSAR